ncbi:putative Reticulon-like protein B14 [Cocos nucifera]|nr:putative Reticulon-like protein B14 [Cocos nucifera]
MVSLWILSVAGSCCSSISLFYFCFVCIQTLPALYERYENEVNNLITTGSRDLKKLYMKLDSKVLGKIPRGPVKEKKFK